MRKVWITQRKGIPGCYVEWYDQLGRRRSKYFAPQHKPYVQNFKARKFIQLNSDCLPPGATIEISWSEAVEQYTRNKQLSGLAPRSMADIANTLAEIQRACHPVTTKMLTSPMIDKFIHYLQNKDLSPNTINKHLRNLRAFIHWCSMAGYMDNISVRSVKGRAKIVTVLSNKDIRALLNACGNDKQWRMRILLAVTTGLRRSDIDNIELRDIDIERKVITAVNRKTQKVTLYQPLPDGLMPHLERFILEEIEPGQIRLFKHKFSKKWQTIKRKAGLSHIQFHDLRRTFGSLQADAGVPIKVLQDMYKHSSIETTMKHYIKTNDTEKRKGVNKLNVNEWL